MDQAGEWKLGGLEYALPSPSTCPAKGGAVRFNWCFTVILLLFFLLLLCALQKDFCKRSNLATLSLDQIKNLGIYQLKLLFIIIIITVIIIIIIIIIIINFAQIHTLGLRFLDKYDPPEKNTSRNTEKWFLSLIIIIMI